MGVREDVLIKYEEQRDRAMGEAGRVAGLITAMLVDVRELRTFVATDLESMTRAVDRLKSLQQQVTEADRSYRQRLAEV